MVKEVYIVATQIQNLLSDTKAERDLLNVQLQTERNSLEQLQGLLSAERHKEFQAHLTGKEREEELQHLRQMLAKLEADRYVDYFLVKVEFLCLID